MNCSNFWFWQTEHRLSWWRYCSSHLPGISVGVNLMVDAIGLVDRILLKLVLAIFCGSAVAIGLTDRILPKLWCKFVVVAIGLADRILLKLVLAIFGDTAVAMIGLADRTLQKLVLAIFGGTVVAIGLADRIPPKL